jgi:hypothetical protein
MHGLATLRSRIARQEARKRPVRRFRPVVFRLYDGQRRDAPVAAKGGAAGIVINRQPGEGEAAFINRAVAAIGARIVILIYPPEIAAEAIVEMPAEHWPDLQPEIEPDLGGIGRRATREELERMGAIHMPPERLR